MGRWSFRTWLALASAAVMIPQLASAEVADLVHFEGRLLSQGGAPVPDGDYGVTMRFYEGKADTQDKALYVYSDTGVKVQSGMFSISVGEKGLGGKIDTKPFVEGKAAWIGVQVGSDPELPRLPIHAVPYALRSLVAKSLDCTGCVKADNLDPDALKGYVKPADLAKVATSGEWADIQNRPAFAAKKVCPGDQVLAGFKVDGSQVCVPDKVNTYAGKDFALSGNKCSIGQVMAGVDDQGKPVCVTDMDTKTVYKAGTGLALTGDTFALDLKYADGRYVNAGQTDAITSAMIKNGEVKAVDVDDAQVQRRVSGTCPAGQAIAQVGADGKVVCAAEVGAASAKWAGSVVKGNWYRIASTKGGQSVAGTFTLYDASGNSAVQFRVGISRGNEAGASFTLLSHSREGSVIFERARLVENSTTTDHYLDVKIANNASVWFFVSDNGHEQAWTPEKWAIKGTSDSVSGFASRIYDLDKLWMVGSSGERLAVGRDGMTRVQTASGYIDLGSQAAQYANLSTDRSAFFFNKGLRVDGGTLTSNKANLTLQTAGVTRAYIASTNGWFYALHGAALCLKNEAGCGLTISDDGGFYDHNDGWIRNQVSNGLLIRDKANKDYRDLQARHVTAHGNLHASGTLNSNGAATLKSTLVVTGAATMNNALTVAGTVAANNGVSVDGQTVIDNSAGWHRSYGKTGWFNNTYSGGIYMEDTSWVRVYGNKHFMVPGNYVVRADGGFQVDGQQVIDADASWHRSYGKAGWLSATYGGGIYMTDTTWVRVYNNKGFLVNNTIEADDANGQVYLGPGTSPYIELRSKKGGTPLVDFSNDASSDYDVRLRLTGNNLLDVEGGWIRNGCPDGMTAKNNFCYSGEQGATNHDAAEGNCANTYGGHLCTIGEISAAGIKDYDYYWVFESCGTRNYVRFRSYYNQSYCTSYSNSYKYVCCRGR